MMKIYWITGEAGAGKTTKARSLAKEINEPTFLIDGDEVREFFADKDFSDEGRMKQIERCARIASEVSKNGIVSIVACVSPKKEMRERAKEMLKDCEKELIFIPGGKCTWVKYEPPTNEEIESWKV